MDLRICRAANQGFIAYSQLTAAIGTRTKPNARSNRLTGAFCNACGPTGTRFETERGVGRRLGERVRNGGRESDGCLEYRPNAGAKRFHYPVRPGRGSTWIVAEHRNHSLVISGQCSRWIPGILWARFRCCTIPQSTDVFPRLNVQCVWLLRKLGNSSLRSASWFTTVHFLQSMWIY